MPCETKIKTIDGHEYTVTQMPPSQAILYETEILLLVGEVAAPLMKAQSQGNQEAIAEALESIAQTMRTNMGPKRFAEVLTELVSSPLVFRDGLPIIFDRDFAGSDGPTKYKLFARVLEVNFLHFLDGSPLGDLIRKAGQRAQASFATSSQTSTSDSGDPSSQSAPSASSTN